MLINTNAKTNTYTNINTNINKTQIQIHANPNIEAQNTEAKQHIAARKRPFPSTFGANVIVSEITHRES